MANFEKLNNLSGEKSPEKIGAEAITIPENPERIEMLRNKCIEYGERITTLKNKIEELKAQLEDLKENEGELKEQKKLQETISKGLRRLTEERVKRFLLARVLSERKIDSINTLLEEGELPLLSRSDKDLNLVQLTGLYSIIRTYCEGKEEELSGGTGLAPN